MDLKDLRALLKLVEASDIEELEIERQGQRVRIRRRGGNTVAAVAAPAPLPPAPAPPALQAAPPATGAPAPVRAENLLTIESPMVGTFYRAPAPGAEPYVKEGQVVEKGSVLCIIEAMKLMNEIEAEVKGRIASILVENAQPVEYSQPLFLVEPI
ncbi:MAG: acetyl-CoA carboxylase biotin carboxyl carrier protein [candidate division NC10 bacterium]|nr:acetyl-CoA carboxylase biotin carboxyl carrier protein [candidate division NC10 bacterium]